MIAFSQDCNNKATRVEIGKHTVFFSYTTPIAYSGPLGECRIPNHWGPTTGRHFKALGVYELPTVSQGELKEKLAQIG